MILKRTCSAPIGEEAARRSGEAAGLASTAGVHGDPVREPMDESHPFPSQVTVWGSKLAEFLFDLCALLELDHRRLRLFNTAGRGSASTSCSICSRSCAPIQNISPCWVLEIKCATTAWLSDTVSAILLVGAHPDARGRVYNVAGEQAIDIRALIDLVIRIVGIPRPEVSFTGKSWKGTSCAGSGTGQLRALGFSPRVGLEDGIRRLVEWHRAEFAPPW